MDIKMDSYNRTMYDSYLHTNGSSNRSERDTFASQSRLLIGRLTWICR